MSRTIGFVGAGSLATALAQALSAQGHNVAAVASKGGVSARRLAQSIPGCRTWSTPQEVADACDVVFIAVPDGAIYQVVSRVRWSRGRWVVHCSGALTLEALEPALRAGAMVGSFHPLQTFYKGSAGIAAGMVVAIEGEGELSSLLYGLARDIGGRPIQIRPQDRPLYHAAAVLSCGYVATLMKLAGDLWTSLGIEDPGSLSALGPLARSTLDAVLSNGLSSATGPIMRGDVDTVKGHLEALAQRMPQVLPVYCHLGLASLPMARARGTVPQDKPEDLEASFSKYASKGRPLDTAPVQSST